MMKFLLDFLPIGLFFIAYKLFGLIIATQVAIGASFIQLIWLRITTGEFQKVHLISCFSILILGGATILLNNEIFVKWKPTVVYWLLSVIFLATQCIGNKPLLQRFGDGNLSLPNKVWRQLNLSWGIFFLLMGLTNIYVVYNFDTNAWVNFKLFGALGLTLAFILAQSLYVAKHLHEPKGNS